MVNSRDKGARGEREARDACKRWWHSKHCLRAAQANGAYSADLLNALPAGHVEVKRYARISALRFLQQAERDKKLNEFPVVLMRENDSPSWVVMFKIEDTEQFVHAFLENQIKHGNCNQDQTTDAT